jgi:putative transposase
LGWKVNKKRTYRIYREEGLSIRTKKRKKRGAHLRVVPPAATGPNERWAMDFVHDRLVDGSRIRILAVIDTFTRECPVIAVEKSFSGKKVGTVLDGLGAERGYPKTITVDNGSEFYSREMDAWAYQHGVKLDFIRPGKPVENAFIESFNGRLRDELKACFDPGFRAPVAGNTSAAVTTTPTRLLARRGPKSPGKAFHSRRV